MTYEGRTSQENRITGAVIFIDEGTNETVGVGMIE